MAELKELIGKICKQVISEHNELLFICDDGTEYKLYHEQDCCENVSIEDICGDLSDLVGKSILIAEEVSNYEPNSEEEIKRTNDSNEWGSCTWTFYKFATINGYVNVRWFGESNGYYSESVDFIQLGV